MSDTPSKKNPDEIRYRVSTGKKSLATKLVSRTGTLKELKAADQALFIALDELNDKDLEKLKKLLDSLDHEPLFIAHESATCD